MQGRGEFPTSLADRNQKPPAGRQGSFERTPEAERLQSALDMHEFGVELYRQRMRREHPEANAAEINSLVRSWLIAPPPSGRLRLS